MATNPSSDLPELIDNTWTNQSADDRLLSIEKMQSQGDAGQIALLYIAHHDEHVQVRCGAIRHLRSAQALEELQQSAADAAVTDAATQQYHHLLAGLVDSALSEDERLEKLHSAPLTALKQIALLTKSKRIGSTAIERIAASEELADLALFAASVHVRKQAVQKIDDKKLLKELQKKVLDKDKTVAKLLAEKLAEVASAKTSAQESATSSASAATEAQSTTTAPDTILVTASETVSDTASDTASKKETAQSDAEPAPKKKKTKSASEKVKAEPPLDPVVEIPRIEKQLSKLSHKHTDALNAARNTLNKLRKSIPEEAAELAAKAKLLHDQLTEKLDKNRAHQEHLQELTAELLTQLQQALDAGQSHDALPTWDKIQGNISNTGGKIRAALQKQANVYKEKLNELRDWKAFAATEKKKELIAQMQHLLDSKMHAADRSKHISKMHQDWKLLGRSNQNEQLWREFKKLSDQAYEPCKEYFKQRKQLMATNFSKRREICERLEAELGKLEADALNIAELNKLLNDADKEWKEHAPIEQAKIKSIQKRYYAAINQLRKSRKDSLRGNGKQKLDLIAQATALAEMDDNKQAMNEAKRLQQEWKKIGPTSFKEDKKFWEDFRAACDKIFAKRNQQADLQREGVKQAESSLTEILHAMEAIYKLDDEAYRSARSDYQTLAQQFTNGLDPRQRNQLKRLQEQFNGLKRNLDARYKSLPDKKQLQLKNSVLEKAGFLQEIETRLLACKDDAQFTAIRDSIDTTKWDAFDNSGDQTYDEALNARLQRIQQATSLASLQTIAKECASKARALCIELEIRANADTPKEDQGLRMQMQLDQLKHGFGKMKPDPKENNSFAMDIELRSYCIGPIEAKLQQQLAQRMEGAIKKLM